MSDLLAFADKHASGLALLAFTLMFLLPDIISSIRGRR